MARELWICPRCGRPFANRDQPHSCVVHSVAERLQGASPHVVALYEAYRALVEQCGPVIITAAKTRIAFQMRMIFSAVTVRPDRLDAHVVLAQRLENPRFTKIESISPRNHVHHFRIYHLADLDDEVLAWLREAYAVGEQKHLARHNDLPHST